MIPSRWSLREQQPFIVCIYCSCSQLIFYIFLFLFCMSFLFENSPDFRASISRVGSQPKLLSACRFQPCGDCLGPRNIRWLVHGGPPANPNTDQEMPPMRGIIRSAICFLDVHQMSTMSAGNDCGLLCDSESWRFTRGLPIIYLCTSAGYWS